LPNTLCHIAIQGPLSRTVLPVKELVWVIFGCLIPDLPWIWLKLLLTTGLFNPYDLRLYFTAQASLFFSLLLAAAIAMYATRKARVWMIIAVNCGLHLLLDALQIKWGNGVHFFAPLDWQMYRLDLFWPEHLLTMGLTILGLIYLLSIWRPVSAPPSDERAPLDFSRISTNIIGVLLFTVYLSAPLLFMERMEQQNTYYIKTMRQVNDRLGQYIEFDRAHYFRETQEIRIYSGEKLKIEGLQPRRSGRVSFKGTFLTPEKLLSSSYHYHRDFRDVASIVGIFLACALLLQSLILAQFKRR
jgi:hypothetical protein